MTEKSHEGGAGQPYPILFLRQGQTPAGTPEDNAYQANVGEAFGLQAVIVIYVNGEPVGEVAPIAVQWEFAGGGSYVAEYQPTVDAAAPDPAVNLEANPVELYYWDSGGLVAIQCTAEAPDGETVQEGGELTLISNDFALVGGVQGTIQIETIQGIPFLSTGVSVGGGDPGFAIAFNTPGGAAYPGWLGAIQLVSSVRQFTGQSGTVYSLVNTQGVFVLDASSTDDDYIYTKTEVSQGGNEEYTFVDTPNNQLLSEINGDPIVSFTVDESFQLYIVFNGSVTPAPNADLSQIWFPATAAIGWGWQATATNDQGEWSVASGQISGPNPLNLQLPSWQGTIRDAALRAVPRRITTTRTAWEGGSPGPSAAHLGEAAPYEG